MIDKIVSLFVRSKVTPLIIGFSIFLGVLSVFNLPREEEPQISVPMFDIFVSYPGATAEEVERRIVNVGERKLWEISGVEYVYSMTQAEGSLITVRFKVGEDVEKSLTKLYAKVNSNLDLLAPGGTQPFIKLRSIDDVPVLTLTFHGDKLDPVSLRRVVAEVQTRLSAVPDVSETTITGGRKRQFQVFLDEDKLNARYLNPLEISRLIQKANVKSAAGHLQTSPKVVAVEADGFFRSKEDLENLVISVSQGGEVYLRDVARVVDGPDEEETSVDFRRGEAAGAGDALPAVTLAISKRKGANASHLCEVLLKKVELMQGQVIPENVRYTITRNYGETADEKSNELLFHMLLAVIGVTLLMGFALGWRESGVVAIAIPMTLSLTLAGFYFLKFTLNRITLFALIFSIGILVDDPIVGVENIVRHLRMAKNKGRELLDVTIEAFREVQSPLILATLTVIAAILPMAFVSGLMGPYMLPIPIGASMAMVFSMMVAFIATPWASYMILGRAHRQGRLKGHGEEGKDDFLTRLYRSYMQPLIYNRRVRTIFIASMVGLLGLVILMVPLRMVKVKMLPFDNKNEFQVIVNMPEGTSLEQTKAALNELAEYIRTVPEVEHITAYAGTSAPYNFNGLVRHYFLRSKPWQGDLQVNLKPKHDRKRQSHDIAQSIRPRVHEIAAKYQADLQVAEVPPGPPVLSTLVFEIYGPSLDGQRKLAADIEAMLKANPDITDVDSLVGAPEKLFSLKINDEKASLNGVPVDDVAALISSSLKGTRVDLAHLPEENEPVDIVLRLPRDKRASLEALLDITVLSRFGNRIPLKDLVTVEEKARDLTIFHKNLQRVSYVLGDVQGRFESPVYAMLGLNKEIEKLELPQPVPAGQNKIDVLLTSQPDTSDRWALKWDGEWQITYEVFRDLGIAFAIVLILIFTLVVGWFQSFKTPWIIMLPIPLTLIGILPAHWMTNTFFTATSMIGMIAGAGIVVRNSIILVDFIELRLKEGMPLEEAVIDAGAKRFRPMLLTAAAVVVGASVILFDPIFQGLALSLMAGEIASTLLSRTAIPVIYYMVMKKGGRKPA